MTDDKYKLSTKSDAELHDWVASYKPGTSEYNAGIQESMRRIAIIEETIEKVEAPVRKRELIAMGIAILSLTAAIIVIIFTYQ